MMRASTIAPAGSWTEPSADSVTLDFDSRFRRRIALKTDAGRELLLDLPEARHLVAGDGLVTEAGIVEVRAADESLAEVRCSDLRLLVRVAWHLGNRHLPTELRGDVIRIRHDHVIEDMLRRLGAEVAHVRAPFNPEGGAYGEGRTHGHDHAPHDHDHHHHE